jgi:hypothetical protein
LACEKEHPMLQFPSGAGNLESKKGADTPLLFLSFSKTRNLNLVGFYLDEYKGFAFHL